jgi:hypothetical protein
MATATSIVPLISRAAPPTDKVRPIYVFMDGHRWCGVSDVATFKRRAAQASADQQDVDQGTFWLSGDQVSTVEEYRTTADLEWSTLVKYHFDPDGNVASAEASFESDDAGKQEATFAVANGRYRSIKGSREASAFTFRRASTLASFPFADLVRDIVKSGGKERCR